MATVLVTGAPERSAEVASALRDAGAEAVVVDDLHRLEEAVSGQDFDGYVQLPVLIKASGESVVGRVEQFLTEGLLSRFHAATTVLPCLGPSARVVLVAGHTSIDVDAPDDAAARSALLRVLAHALRAERAPNRLSVKICDRTWTAAELAGAVLRPSERRTPPTADPSDATATAYADWRTEVLGLMGAEF